MIDTVGKCGPRSDTNGKCGSRSYILMVSAGQGHKY